MRALVLLLAAVALAGCGSDDGEDGSGSGPLSVQEALESSSGEPVVVEGGLLASGNVVQLCEALAESYPPQCSGARLEVQGLDLASLSDVQTAQGVSWRDWPTRLTGTLEDGVLTVSQNAQP
jgi:hypothetical protein